MRTSPPQRSMSSGEISPLLARREDYQRHQTGLARCRGFLPMIQGGVTRAPGTIWRGEAPGADRLGRGLLVPFVFATDDAVVLEFTSGLMRVWRYGELVRNPNGVIYELATPWDAAALSRLQWVQAADVMWFADGAGPVRKLSRFRLDSWTLAPALFRRGPFQAENLDRARTLRLRLDGGSYTVTGAVQFASLLPDVRAQAAAQMQPGGTVTLLGSAGFFASAAPGDVLQLTALDHTIIPIWTGNTAITPGGMMRYDGQIYMLEIGANTGINPPVHREGVQFTDTTTGTRWRWMSGLSGIVRLTQILSPAEARAEVVEAVSPALLDDPSHRWAEAAWSHRAGWPSVLEIHEQRLFAAASPTEPRTIWASVIGDFEDFSPGVEADDAFTFIIAGSDTQNRIVWLKSGKKGLQIGATGEEYSTRSLQRGQAIGPTTAVFGLDSTIGSIPQRPIAPDADPIFISRDRRRVFQVIYRFENDANEARDLTRPSDHIGEAGFAQAVLQRTPDRLIWIRRDSGDLAVLLNEPAEDVLGWATLSLAGGWVESLCVTPALDGRADVLTMLVRREVGGETRRFVEELADPYGLTCGPAPCARAVHLFAALTFDLVEPVTEFSLPWLAGETVWAWTDRGSFGPLVVAGDGALHLPDPVRQGCIGLHDPSHEIETLDIVASDPSGHTMGRQKRIKARVGVALWRTGQAIAQVVERGLDELREGKPLEIRERPVASSVEPVVSGIARLALPSGMAREIALRFRPVGGVPFTLLGLTPTVEGAGD